MAGWYIGACGNFLGRHFGLSTTSGHSLAVSLKPRWWTQRNRFAGAKRSGWGGVSNTEEMVLGRGVGEY